MFTSIGLIISFTISHDIVSAESYHFSFMLLLFLLTARSLALLTLFHR